MHPNVNTFALAVAQYAMSCAANPEFVIKGLFSVIGKRKWNCEYFIQICWGVLFPDGSTWFTFQPN